MTTLQDLQPQKVYQFFTELNQIPRGTFNSGAASDYCAKFAKDRGLEYIQDGAKNVIIKKPGTAGYENAEPVILQGHVDMVCQKTEDSNHDFEKDPIEMYVEDGYVKAKDTTLGADNGVAVAYALAVLDSDDIKHPPLEVLFTIDEEIGMGGAKAIDLSVLKGKMLLNLDSEEEGTILAGCAGGVNQKVEIPAAREEKTGTVVQIKLNGLTGGHSGTEIHKQRGNANKMMGRFLMAATEKVDYQLIQIAGGDKENVITSVNTVKLMTDAKNVGALEAFAAEMTAIWKQEFGKDEPNVALTVTNQGEKTEEVMTKEATKNVVFFVTSSPYGVQCYSRELAGLVETSLNFGVLYTEADKVVGVFMIRSEMESKKMELTQILSAWAERFGGCTSLTADYPAWMYKADSKLRPIMVDTYKEVFGEDPIITTLHAGLECGILSGQKPDLDCVSFGPNILDAHSTKERLNIESAERMWNYLLKVLENCK